MQSSQCYELQTDHPEDGCSCYINPLKHYANPQGERKQLKNNLKSFFSYGNKKIKREREHE